MPYFDTFDTILSMTNSVLVYLLKTDKSGNKHVCLGRKKTGHGVGKWNGFGGGIEKGEDSIAAAVREVREESGVLISSDELIKLGKITYFESSGDWSVDVFTCRKWKGEIISTKEMEPKWFAVSSIPYGEMWPNDKVWMPTLLEEKEFKIRFWHDDEGNLLKKEWKNPGK